MTDTNSSINNLIGTFATINTGSTQPIADQLVCIDTSNNRIGINTVDPSFSIHVLGNNDDGTISSNHLKVDNITATSTTVILKNLPTTEPVTVGQLWNDSGTIKIKQ